MRLFFRKALLLKELRLIEQKELLWC